LSMGFVETNRGPTISFSFSTIWSSDSIESEPQGGEE
jgi:hypothetical protein